MTGTIYALLLQQSEIGPAASLWGRPASRHFGKPFDRLLAKGVLCEQAPAETWATCRYCSCDYDHRLIREINGRLLAMCPWDHKADDELEPDDLRSFAIRREKLVDLIRVANDLGQATSEIMPRLWRVGETKGGRSVLIALDRQALSACLSKTRKSGLIRMGATHEEYAHSRNPDHPGNVRFPARNRRKSGV